MNDRDIEKTIIKKYHEYVVMLEENGNTNVSYVRPKSFDVYDENSCAFLVLAVLSIQDKVMDGCKINKD